MTFSQKPKVVCLVHLEALKALAAKFVEGYDHA
jgi:hypothetical protein